MVLVVTAAIAGVGVGLFASVVVAASEPMSAAGGVSIGAMVIAIASVMEHHRWRGAEDAMPTLFPTMIPSHDGETGAR